MNIRNPAVKDDLAAGRLLSLDIGAGDFRRPGYYSVDLRELPGVDIVADLEEPLTELPDGSVGSILASHVLEHVQRLPPLMAELHRVLDADGELEIRVPHFANPYARSDPTHVREFGLYTLSYFVPVARQPLHRKVPNYWPDTPFVIDSIAFGFRSKSRTVRALSRAVNARRRVMEAFERNATGVIWPYELLVRCRPLK